MSSYLNFYLLPKESKEKYTSEGETEIKLSTEPLNLCSYSRSSAIYQAFNSTLNIAYAGNEYNYTELTKDKMKQVIDYVKSDLKKAEKRLEINYKILKEHYNEDICSEIHSSEEYVSDLKNVIEQLDYFDNLVNDVSDEYNDFQKILINII